MSKEESYQIQLLRGIAIIGVICIHSVPPGSIQIWLRPFINFSVAMFLFLSGFLSKSDRWNPGRRIKKVVIPYILWTVIYTALNSRFGFKSFVYSLVLNAVTGQAAAIMYYIFVYIQLTLLIPAADKLSNSKFRYIGLFVTPVEIILFRFLPLLTGIQFGTVLSTLIRLSCLGWFSYFYLGFLIGNTRATVLLKNRPLALLVTFGLIWQIVEGYFYLQLGSADAGTQLKLSSCFTNMFLMLLAYRFITNEKKACNNFLYLIGNNSFGIYFAHLAIIQIFSLNSVLVFPINAIVTTMISLAFVLVMKRILGKWAWTLAL